MVRGRRRAKAPTAKNGENPPRPVKTMKMSTEFQGKLSHASPTPKITSYFATDEKNEDSPRKPASTTSVLQQANNIEKKSPHRIEMTEAVEAKKLAKPRRKINTDKSLECKTQKLTDYFPVRRSVRKTKKTVLEEKQRHIENAILSKREDGLQVHNFPGKGRGVVATRPFKRGDFVVEYAGELIPLDEARSREARYAQDQNTGCYMYYFVHKDVSYCIDATAESKRLGRLVNHSRYGNLVTKSLMVGGIPRLVLIAKDDINPGDEIMYDYGDRSRESLFYHPWLAL